MQSLLTSLCKASKKFSPECPVIWQMNRRCWVVSNHQVSVGTGGRIWLSLPAYKSPSCKRISQGSLDTRWLNEERHTC